MPTEYLYVLYVSQEKKHFNFPYNSSSRLVFITQMKSVYSAVGLGL